MLVADEESSEYETEEEEEPQAKPKSGVPLPPAGDEVSWIRALRECLLTVISSRASTRRTQRKSQRKKSKSQHSGRSL